MENIINEAVAREKIVTNENEKETDSKNILPKKTKRRKKKNNNLKTCL